MSFEAITSFTTIFKTKIGEFFTVNDTNLIMQLASDVLSGFDMEMTQDINSGTDNLLNVYFDSLHVGGRSEKTIIHYKYVLSRLFSDTNVGTRNITVYHLRNYLAKEKARGLADSTLEGYRQIFSAYFQWMHREGIISNNPTANLSIIKCKKKMKVIYSDIDIEHLKRNCRSLRDKTILCFLLSTACRIGELTKLNRNDIDFANLECTVLGKGNKERTVYMDAITGMLLKEYLNSRTDDNEALFVSLHGNHGRITNGGIQCMLRELGKRANVEKVHAHKFRRTRATKLIRHGMAIQEVAEILGHDKLDTTMEYVVMDKTSIKNAYQKFA